MPEAAAKEAQEQLILTNQGQPFASREMAAAAITKKKLDKNSHDVIELEDGGWAIKEVPSKAYVEKYYRVRFHAKAQPNDPDDVTLACNGENLIFRREQETIIPGRFKEVADHGQYVQFRQVPNKPRKIVANVRIFPYDMLGESTEAEFRQMLKEGNKKQKDMISKYGYNFDPEDGD